jgi:hypothetical protein
MDDRTVPSIALEGSLHDAELPFGVGEFAFIMCPLLRGGRGMGCWD